MTGVNRTDLSTLGRLTSLEVELHGRLQLRRAWPRGIDRLSLEYVDPSGTTLAGQWLADHGRAENIASGTPGALQPAPGIVLQPDGADRRLRALRDLVHEPGAALVGHRPERRAVVRRANGWFTKIVRPDRADDLLACDRRARELRAITLAPLIDHDTRHGTVSWEAVAGGSLHDLLVDTSVEIPELERAGRAIGTAVRALHAARPSVGLAVHRPGHELEAAERWIRAAARLACVPPGAVERLHEASRTLVGSGAPVCVVHRDLHDKQLLVDGDDVVVLDVDTLALGDPAVDLANLLVHLDLRVLQGVSATRVDTVRTALLTAYRPDRSTWDSVPGYAAATRARLAGVYAFRPAEAVAAGNIAIAG